ncbi:hypothetical protein JL721_4361 [Aureococcus anophagefferens]|nr:hypothetical protein JL721_4361 [Aureococcus anophagefferens]
MAAPVDDPKWRIFCVARIKPVGEGEAAAVVQESATQLSVPHPDDDDEEPTEGRLTFTMDAICGPEATQQDVYALFKPIVASTCKGRNGCVFAYGQTGSGKTHTVVGGDDFRSRGLVPRAIGQVFREAAKRRRKGGDVAVSCTFAQVYDDALYDLLDEGNESDDVGEWTKASVLEGDDGSLTFEGLAEYGADEEEDALRLLWVGTARRVLGQTKANDASSRSHAVFTIYVVDAQRKTRAKLHLVDLAGSERFGAWSDGRRGTRARTSRLHRRRSRAAFRPRCDGGASAESRNINLSLHYLEQVVRALRDGNNEPRHVPYRNCVLTRQLPDRARRVRCRARDHAAESTATCRFALRCGDVRAVDVVANVDVDPRRRAASYR